MAESMDALLQGMQTGINGPNHSCTPPGLPQSEQGLVVEGLIKLYGRVVPRTVEMTLTPTLRQAYSDPQIHLWTKFTQPVAQVKWDQR